MLKGYLRDCRRYGSAFGLLCMIVFSQPGLGLAVDLLPYFCPDCVGGSYAGYGQRNHVGGECFYTYPETVKNKTGFTIVKSCNDPQEFEEFNYDNSFIYHLSDTTWATNRNGQWTNARCYDGREAYSTYLNGSFGQQNGSCSGFTPNMGKEGGIWVPRYMSVGGEYSHHVTVVGLAEDDCQCCQAQYTGPTGRRVKFVSQERMDLLNGLGTRDVIRVAIMDGPGAGENYWYALNYGWIAMGHASPPDAPKSLWDGDIAHMTGVDYNRRSKVLTCSTPPSPTPPSTLDSLTGGRVLDESGNPESPVGNMSPTTAAVQPGETRQAEHYWGLRGIDWAGTRGESCNAGRVHIAGWHQGDLAEYLVNFPSSSQSYTLNVIGLPDDPNPVQVNVYIDGSYYGQISWNDGNPRCNEGEGGSSQKIEMRGFEGVHAVAFQFANDWSSTCSPWRDDCDRNFWFDYFTFTSGGGTTSLPDVMIEDLWWSPPNPQPDDRVTFNVRVRNQGNAATSQAPGAKEGGKVGVAYFINGNYFSYGLRDSMAAGEVSSSFSMVQPWTAKAGAYEIRARVDDVDRFQESNEDNNGFTKTLNVGSGSSSPYPNCPCSSGIDNYCQHSPSTSGCPMTFPGGYCDPNGDRSFSDADWYRGYQEFQQYCR